MMRRIRLKVVFLLSLLVFVSVVAGFFIGIIFSAIIAKKKEDPAFMKKTTMQSLDKLHPTPEQRQKFETHTDKLVGEISEIRKQAWAAMGAFNTAIDQELTPEQREVFNKKIKTKPPGEQKSK